MNLSSVSKTAIVTLVFRVIASERKLMKDEMATGCLNNLLANASEKERKQILKIKKKHSGRLLSRVKAFVSRATYFDKIADEFVAKYPSPTIINLGCGFDTRFWRINNSKCRYIDLDLPEVIAMKKELLGEHRGYEQIGYSVLDLSWIDHVTSNGNSNFLLIAEGLLVYIPENDVRNLLETISKKFMNSQIAFNVVPLKFTRGFWKFMLKFSMKKIMRVNLSYVFGINKPADIEQYAKGIRVIDYQSIKGVWFINASVNQA